MSVNGMNWGSYWGVGSGVCQPHYQVSSAVPGVCAQETPSGILRRCLPRG